MENEFSLLSQNIVLKSLDWAYEKAIYGVKGLDSAAELANNYLKGKGTLIEQVNSLIKWQNNKAGTSGFITGLGGLLTMTVTLPTNITSVLYIQIRMVAAIAIMGGYDVKDDRVKTLVYSCVAANSTAEVAKTFGLKLGEKLMKEGIKRLSKETIIRINQAVGFRLLTKFGQKGVINMGKSVPFIGGIISATFDIVSTNIIGNIAREIFIINEV